MSLYSKNELLIKSKEELYNIALKEKIIDILTDIKTKKELIDIILKYRKDYNEYSLRKFSELGFYNLQNMVDKRLISYNKSHNDIEISRSIKIYEDVNFMKQEDYYVIIEKYLEIDPSIVFLVGKNNYIYGLLNFEKDKRHIDKNYEKFNLVFNINRFNKNFNNNEKMSLIFFNTYNIEIINKIYNDEKLLIIPDKIISYKVDLVDFNYLSLNKTFDSCPILISCNKIITKYFEYEFELYVKKISDDDVVIYFFNDAKNSLEAKNYNTNSTYISNLNYLLENPNEKIYLYDELLNFKILMKKEILKILFSYIKEMIISYSKKKYQNFNIIGIDYEDENLKKIEVTTLYNYLLIKNKIKDIEREFKSKPYLIINTDNNNINISLNKYKILEKDINYEIDLQTKILNSSNISKNKIIEKIFYHLKYKISSYNILPYKEKELLNLIKNNEYENIIKKIESKFLEIEENFNTDYLVYQSSVNNKYKKVLKNHLILKKISSYIFEKYIENEKINFTMRKVMSKIDDNLEIKDFEIIKDEIDLIFILELYTFLNRHFKEYNILEILKNYEGINLCGKMVKTKMFYNLLKEFIPGNLICFDDDKKDSDKVLIDICYKFNRDKNLGRIKFNENIEKIKKKIKIYVKDFKNEYRLMLETDKLLFNYIDKINTAKKIEIKIEYLDDEKIVKYNQVISNIFEEKDEKNIGIDQKYLNNIENGVIRIFFFLTDKLIVNYVKRFNDQLFFSEMLELL